MFVLVRRTGDGLWLFCGTQLKDVRISKTADDLSMFRATQLKDVVCGTGNDLWVFRGTQLRDVLVKEQQVTSGCFAERSERMFLRTDQ